MENTRFSIDHVNFIHGEKRIDIENHYEKTDKLIQKTGIPTVWESSKNSYQLALECLNNEETREKIQKSNLKTILYVTQTPEWFLPAHACKIQEELGLENNIQALDINQGCSGFVQSLSLATKILNENESALILTTDCYRSKLEKTDRATNVIFSDGAAAVLITGNKNGHKILGETNYTNGVGFGTLSHKISKNQETYLEMNGWEVKQYVQQNLLNQIELVLEKANLKKNQVNTALLHQASFTVLEETIKNLQESGVTTPMNLHRYGNTTSSTIPSLLYDFGGLKENETTLLSGFGVGFIIANMIIGPRR
jgi:3-oxoacyl-[acyl-carrier-protein] synthase-3